MSKVQVYAGTLDEIKELLERDLEFALAEDGSITGMHVLDGGVVYQNLISLSHHPQCPPRTKGLIGEALGYIDHQHNWRVKKEDVPKLAKALEQIIALLP